jgi:thiol-disulfide isomerase/thioredoxin
MLIRIDPNISSKRFPMATMRECPVCGIRVKLENLEGHLKKVHPNVKVDALLTDDDKTDIKIAKKKQLKTGAPFEDAERKRWAIGGVIIAIVVALILVFMALPPPIDDGIVEPGDLAPPFRYSDVDNEPYDLNAHIGNHLILLEFFYTECHWCIEIHPNLEELYTYYGNGAQVELVSISADSRDSFEDVRGYRDVHGSAWTFIASPESLSDTYGISATPTLFLIDLDGYILEKVVGYKTTQQLKDIIDPHL